MDNSQIMNGEIHTQIIPKIHKIKKIGKEIIITIINDMAKTGIIRNIITAIIITIIIHTTIIINITTNGINGIIDGMVGKIITINNKELALLVPVNVEYGCVVDIAEPVEKFGMAGDIINALLVQVVDGHGMFVDIATAQAGLLGNKKICGSS